MRWPTGPSESYRLLQLLVDIGHMILYSMGTYEQLFGNLRVGHTSGD